MDFRVDNNYLGRNGLFGSTLRPNFKDRFTLAQEMILKPSFALSAHRFEGARS
jgi:hypothetical protein